MSAVAPLAALKRLARDGLDRTLPQALLFEQERVVRELMKDDVAVGLAAFEARRTPGLKSKFPTTHP